MTAISKTIERRDDHPQATNAARHATRERVSEAGIVPASYFRWKGPFDRLAAAALLIPGSLLIALLVILVRLTSRGPGIYAQARVGKDGHRFRMYKIRTMRQDAEAVTGPVWTQPQDPRVTPVGRILRKLHLDELPQLFNVLKGEMAMVGPRPERPEFVRVLARAIPSYRKRLAVRPGITGLAQINLPPDSDLPSVQRKLVLDCEYIEHGGPWLDTRLMICTFLRIFKVSESWLLHLLRLGRNVSIPGLAVGESIDGGQGHPLSGRGSAEPAQTTPAAVLLQIADLPDTEAPQTDGDAKDRALHNGNGDSHHHGHGHGTTACGSRAGGAPARRVGADHGKPR